MCNEMYPAVHNKDGSLAHSTQCEMDFGRKDKCYEAYILSLQGVADLYAHFENYKLLVGEL